MDMEKDRAVVKASARLVVQMTPKEKRDLQARARRAGVPVSQFVRNRIGSDDGLDEHREEIEALLTEIERRAPAILASLDSSIAALDEVIGREPR